MKVMKQYISLIVFSVVFFSFTSHATSFSKDLALKSARYPINCSKIGDTTFFRIVNEGVNTLNFSVDSIKIYWSTLSGPSSFSGNISLTAGTLSPGDSLELFTDSIDFLIDGNYSVQSYLSSTWDTLNRNNDSLISNLNAVKASPIVSMSTLPRTCANAPTITLNGGAPSGGIYFGNGVNVSVLEPINAGPGTHQIFYSFSATNGCADTASSTIVLDTIPLIIVSPVGQICANDTLIPLNFASPTGGVYSGPGVSGLFWNPFLAGSGNTGLSYKLTDLNQCSDSTSVQIQVLSLPIVTLSLNSKHCLNLPPLTLTGGQPSGGSYSGIHVVGGDYIPSAPQLDTIFYSYTDATNCTNRDTAVIEAVLPPSVYFASIPNICVGSDSILLTQGSPIGGAYSGNNLNQSKYGPTVITKDTLTYTYTDTNNCVEVAQQIVSVDSVPVVSFSGLSGLCENTPSFPLIGGMPAGGTYRGKGVSGSVYEVDSVGIGFDTLAYVFVDANGCGDSVSVSVEIKAKPLVSLTNFTPVCSLDSAFMLSNGIPAGGTYNGPSVFAGVFTPDTSVIGLNRVTYIYTNSNSCTDSVSKDLMVGENPVFNLGPDMDICGESKATLSIPLSNMIYVWNTGDSSSSIQVETSGVFSASVIDTSTSANCAFEDTIRVDYDAVCLGISSKKIEKRMLTCYPNPTFGLLTLSLNGEVAEQITAELIDMRGQILLSKTWKTQEQIVELEMDLSEFPNGMYTVRAFVGKQQYTQRISLMK